VHAMIAGPGLVVVDTALNVVAVNTEAIQILIFPERRDKIADLKTVLTKRVRSSLLDPGSSYSSFFKEFRSAKRVYQCRCFSLNSSFSSNGDTRPTLLVMLERKSDGRTAVAALSHRFGLTAREEETVQLLVEGLTSKEIATRMKISPNTVKGFIRLIMVKMNVFTRSGIIGKILETERMKGNSFGIEKTVPMGAWPSPDLPLLPPR
jgi:DNA-binding CsgD family transcriptional regulator